MCAARSLRGERPRLRRRLCAKPPRSRPLFINIVVSTFVSRAASGRLGCRQSLVSTGVRANGDTHPSPPPHPPPPPKPPAKQMRASTGDFPGCLDVVASVAVGPPVLKLRTDDHRSSVGAGGRWGARVAERRGGKVRVVAGAGAVGCNVRKGTLSFGRNTSALRGRLEDGGFTGTKKLNIANWASKFFKT